MTAPTRTGPGFSQAGAAGDGFSWAEPPSRGPRRSRILSRGTYQLTTAAPAGNERYVFSPRNDVSEAGVCLGQYDFEPWAGKPPVRQAEADDYDRRVVACESGRLTVRAALRALRAGTLGGTYEHVGQVDTWAMVAEVCQIALVVCPWFVWDGPIGAAAFPPRRGANLATGPGYYQKRWGPELVHRMSGAGACEVDVRRWTGGARFATLWLVSWHHTLQFNGVGTNPPPIYVDWQTVDDVTRSGDDVAPWPTSHLYQQPLGGDFPAPHGAGATDIREHLIAQTAMVRGSCPKTVWAHNASTGGIDYLVQVMHGLHDDWIGPVAVGAGASSQLANVDNVALLDHPTAINVYAANAADRRFGTISFSGA